ncbi:hypothetical protein A4G19_09865 [Pasteurellaceae bacterium Macca]|nr:hypothetical protein [Pasteurellaceae bacterium Macca]MCK3656052.1 hypothetical protein [Pasteurellaceae bacterium Macca]
MLCAIYKSCRKEGMYLYVAKRDEFDAVPDSLRQAFGKPQFVMLFNLAGEKPLARADKKEVQQHLEQTGFYLQMPPPVENLHTTFVAEQRQQAV